MATTKLDNLYIALYCGSTMVCHAVSVICHNGNHKVAPQEVIRSSFFRLAFLPRFEQLLSAIEVLSLIIAPFRIILDTIRFLIAHF